MGKLELQVLRRPAPPEPPPDRGPLLTPEQVAQLVGGVSTAWVRRAVPGKLRLGQRTVRWYQGDVLAWLAAHRPALG